MNVPEALVDPVERISPVAERILIRVFASPVPDTEMMPELVR